MRHRELKPVQAHRIVNEDLLMDRRVGRPHLELVEHKAIVDLEQRRWVARFSAKFRCINGASATVASVRSSFQFDLGRNAVYGK